MRRSMIPLLACTSFLLALVLDAFGQQQANPKVLLERGVAFGKGGSQDLLLDLAMPTEGDGPFPAVVCLHGGGWIGGDRTQMEQTIKVLAARGYVAVSPDYRLAPHDRFPAQIEDSKAAVRWLRAHAAKYKVDPHRIGAVGYSAGAHLACLLGVTEKADGLEGTGGHLEESSQVQAVVSFFGPTDLTRADLSKEAREQNLVPLLGGTRDEKPDAYRLASPLSHVRKGAPPFLFLHGGEDPVVPPAHSCLMADKLETVGSSAKVVVVPGEGHGLHGEKLHNGLVEMMAFFDAKLKP